MVELLPSYRWCWQIYALFRSANQDERQFASLPRRCFAYGVKVAEARSYKPRVMVSNLGSGVILRHMYKEFILALRAERS